MYASKRLPEAARNYSITESELCGLAINTASFSHLLKRVDFDAMVDHLSLTHIIKGKAEPATIRIKGLLELISSYSFNFYYIKGKDMVLSDFLLERKGITIVIFMRLYPYLSAGLKRKRSDPINQTINPTIRTVTENSLQDQNRNR